MIHERANTPLLQAKSKMEGSTSSQEDLKSIQETKLDPTESKRRKVGRGVVRVRVEANGEKQKGEGPPSDSWSWRKYGQKPIKGSPYPRGYYRCSSLKGCSAKKQVERCRTDASVLIITYTSDHNHPGPDLPSINPPSDAASLAPDSPQRPTAKCGAGTPTNLLAAEGANDHLSTFDEVGATPCSNMVTPSASRSSEEDDFFDELEELPISSSFTGLVRSSFFDDRILLLPS